MMVLPSTSEFRNAVASTELFSALDGDALEDFAGRLTRVRVRAGDTLFHQGDPSRSLYIVLEGRLRLTACRADGRREIVSELGRGGCAGATALIAGCAHNATARAVRDLELLELTREEFERSIGYPTLFDIMSRTVMLSSTRALEDARRNADLYVRPAVEDFGLFEWDAIDRIVDEGYRATLANVGAWKQVLSA